LRALPGNLRAPAPRNWASMHRTAVRRSEWVILAYLSLWVRTSSDGTIPDPGRRSPWDLDTWLTRA
jgi:hypothetical protein